MLKHKTLRLLLWAPLLGGALLVSGCAATTVGVGLGVAVPAPWGGVTVGATVPVGGWYGGPRW
ncbi:hypothetical protein ACLESO_05950 [Pyxidicoccus sp. 3LG]